MKRPWIDGITPRWGFVPREVRTADPGRWPGLSNSAPSGTFGFAWRALFAVSVVCLSHIAAVQGQEQAIAIAPPQRTDAVDFQKEILPILNKNCLACHNAADREGSLVLETPQTILKGGASGPAVVAGKADESYLMLVASHQMEPFMPPAENKVGAANLTPDELGLIKVWIDQGATGTVTSDLGPLAWQPLPATVNPIVAVSLTPDGQFAACGRANQVFIYHVPTGRLLTRLTDPALLTQGVYDKPGVAHLDIVQALAFHPTENLLASSAYKEVKLWRRPLNSQTLKLAAGDDQVRAVAASGDGKWLATAGADQKIRLFDAATGTAGPVLAGHTGIVTSLAFSADSTKLVSGSADKTVRIWNVADGGLAGRIDTPTSVNAVALLRGGQQIATGGDDSLIRLWAIPAAAPRTLSAPAGQVTASTHSPAKKLLAQGYADGRLALIDISTNQVTVETQTHAAAITSLSFDASGNRLAIGSADRKVVLWDVAGNRAFATFVSGLAPTSAVALHPGGAQVAGGGDDGRIVLSKVDAPPARSFGGDNGIPAAVTATSADGSLLATGGVVDGKPAIVVYEVASGTVVRAILGHERTITSLAFSADRTRLASGAADNTARVWNVADGVEIAKFTGHAAPVTAVGFNAAGDQVVSGSGDGGLKLWAVAGGAEIKNFAGHTAAIVGAFIRADGQAIVSASVDQTVRIWNPADGAQVRAISPGGPIGAFAPSRDQNRLAVATADNLVRIYNYGDGAQLYALAGHKSPAKWAEFSADGSRCVTGAADNQAIVWDLANGGLIEIVNQPLGLSFAAYGPATDAILVGGEDRSIQVHTLRFERSLAGVAKRISDLCYSNDGGLVYASSEDGTVRGFQSGDGQPRFNANHGAPVWDLACSADGQFLASAGDDKQIRVWNAGDGNPSARPQLAGFSAAVRSVTFSPDSLHIVGGSAGNEVLVFNVADGVVEQAFSEHTGPVFALAGAGDAGELVISVSADQSTRVWPLVAGRRIQGHSQAVTSLATVPVADTQFVSGGLDGLVRQWNADDGGQIREFNHGGPVAAVAVRADGKRIAAAGPNNLVRLWDADNNQQVAELKGDHRLQAQVARRTRQSNEAKARLAETQTLLAAAEADVPVKDEANKKAIEAQTAATTDLATKEAAYKTAAEAKAVADKLVVDTTAVATSAETARKTAEEESTNAAAAAQVAAQTAAAAATASANAPNDANLAQAKLDAEKASTDAATAATQAAEKLRLATEAKTAADAAVADATTKAQAAATPATEAEAAFKAAEQVKLSAEKTTMLAANDLKKATDLVPATREILTGWESKVKSLDESLAAEQKTATDSEKPLKSLAFSADGLQLAAGGEGMGVHVWGSNDGAPIEAFHGHAGEIMAVAFTPAGSLVSGSADKSAVVWNLEPEWVLERTLGGIDKPDFVDRVVSLEFSADGSLLATGGGEPSRSGEVKLFNTADGSLVRELTEPHSDTVFGVSFSSDGKYLATAAADKFVKTFDVASGEFVRGFEGHTNHVLDVAWKSDGKTLASCGADSVIKVWTFETGEQQRTIPGFAKQVTSISFIGDSPNTLSTSGDSTVRMHQAENGQNYRNLSGATDFMYSSSATPDGKLILAGGQDSRLRLWNGESGQSLATFEPPGSVSE